MASIVLGTVGSAAGGVVGGAVGASLGATLGKALGASVDSHIFGGTTLPERHGPRLEELMVQVSTYGRAIPRVYGTVRLAGNVIWSRPIKETSTTTTATTGGGKGGGGKVSQSTTTYSYSVSMAIAVAEGPIDAVLRIWADAKLLDMSQGTYRIYKGDEGQLPDPFIESYEGVGSTPAYRGLAYIVVEDFPLEGFGNRIPNFTFEVKKKSQKIDNNDEILEEMVKSVILIPGAGEFVYDTTPQYKIPGQPLGSGWAQQGNRIPINLHNPHNTANVKLALDQMVETLPNLEWVGVVVTWFGTSLDAGDCIIVPGVEYKTGGTTAPDTWVVAGRTRATAHQVTLENGSPRYGGTPDDDSILHLIAELKARGYKVMLYPMFFMDVPDKPWRGRVTGSACNVSSFFIKTNGYNAFIMRYANLVQGQVDVFVIGSELVGLTKVTDVPSHYPAVSALVNLAASVRGAVGAGVRLTYAADWSEYHHTDGGWYQLDPLWASPDIDMVGIDAYFPLTDAAQQGYDVDAVRAGWTSGEGYDCYYADSERTNKQPLGAAYAWKNLQWWWENPHINPNGIATAWVPQSKPIWFTEYGFPSVDGATNQPNVFYDPTSSESYFPRFSRGRVDFRAQRMGLQATEQQWKDSSFIERMFLWTWDARPFPYWPDLQNVWADGDVWKTGHWLQGKLGMSNLAAIVADICRRVGLGEGDIDVSSLTDLVEGYIIPTTGSARSFIEQLMGAYFFDAVESEGVLKFVPRSGVVVQEIPQSSLVPIEEGRGVLSIRRAQEIELPQKVSILYLNRIMNYTQGHQFAIRQATQSRNALAMSLPLVLSDQGAKVLAEQWLYTLWVNRTEYECYLPPSYAMLEPADVVDISLPDATHRMRITEILQSHTGLLRVRGVAEDAAAYDVYAPPASTDARIDTVLPVGASQVVLLDLPLFPNDNPQQPVLRMAAIGEDAGWKGTVLYRSSDSGGSYQRVATGTEAAVMGTALTVLSPGEHTVPDEASSVEVLLLGQGTLESAPLEAVLNGANAALLGEEILQFTTAELLGAGQYRLSGLLRGRLGTEYAISGHNSGEQFILLNDRIALFDAPQGAIGLPRLYKGVTVGATLGGTQAQTFTYGGRAWKPYSPVHITGERATNGDLTIRWVRRSRSGGAWRDYVDAPLNESQERYEVEIVNGANVQRTLSTTVPETVYNAAAQIMDFGNVQATVSVRIYQISDVVGRGDGVMATV